MNLRWLAIALWLASLFTPTARSAEGKYLLGYEVAVSGAMGLLALLPASLVFRPLYWLSLATNMLVAGEAIRLLRQSKRDVTLRRTLLLQGTLLFNLAVAWHLHANGPRSFTHIPGLLSLPGVYLWLAAFVVLAAIATYEHRTFFAGLSARVVLTFLVAASTVAGAYGILNLVRG